MSFKSVKTTGDLGKELSDEATNFAYGSRLCRALYVTSPDFQLAGSEQQARGTPSTCDQLDAAERGWSRVLKSLGLYGKALSELADQDSVDLSAQAGGLRKAFEAVGFDGAASDSAKAATTAASTLVGILFDEIRRGRLKDKIQKANPFVQEIVQGLDAHVTAELRVIRALRADLFAQGEDLLHLKVLADCAVDVALKNAEGLPAEGVKAEASCEWDSEEVRFAAATLAYAQEGWLLGRELELVETRTELLAFAKSHQILTKNASTLGKQDAKHLAEIIKSVKEVYEEGAKALEKQEEEQ